MSDLISREDAIKAVTIAALDDRDELEAIKELPSAEAVSREAYEAIKKHAEALEGLSIEDRVRIMYDSIDDVHNIRIINDAPSADAKPTVIQSKTLFPTKDFKEWAKRIREINPNAVVIPCDAEVVSAEAVQGEWVRKYDDKVNCYWYECDQCGEYRPRNQFGHEYNAHFCPNCGAKMHKGGDSE